MRAGVPLLPQPSTSKFVIGYDFSGIDSTVTVVGSGIDNVTDSSGNANTGTQTTDARRLLYGSAAINGRLVADSGAVVSRHLVLPATITGFPQEGQPPYHMFAVFKATTWTAATDIVQFLNGGGSIRTGLRLSTTGGNRVEARLPAAGPSVVTLLSTETTLTTNTLYLAELIADNAGNGGLYVNNGTPALALGTVANSGEALPTRRLYGLSSAFDGLLGAFYLFNDQLTVPERTEWLAFIANRWGFV